MTLDAARESLSRANTNLGNATRGMWRAQALLDQAVADGDPYDIGRAEAGMNDAEQEYARSLREHAAAESALLALAEQGEF